MPIRFRCSLCDGRLSIAKRKAGALVDCPKCGHDIIVPDADEPDDRVEGADRPTEMELHAAFVPPTERQRAAKNGAAKHAVPPAPVKKPAPKPKDDPPLFEHSDFDRVLDPAVKKAAAPAPAPPAVAPSPLVPDDGFYVARSSVVVLVVMMFFLLVMAFATGYIMGS